MAFTACNVDGNQLSSVLMNEEVSNPLPPKLTFQINLEGSGVLYILWASRERVAESKYVENFAVLLVQCNKVIK